MTATPDYWMDERSGVLRPAVEAYLKDGEMTAMEVAAMRAYLRQFIDADVWKGPVIGELRRRINDLTSRQAIEVWLDDAIDAGIDPL